MTSVELPTSTESEQLLSEIDCLKKTIEKLTNDNKKLSIRNKKLSNRVKELEQLNEELREDADLYIDILDDNGVDYNYQIFHRKLDYMFNNSTGNLDRIQELDVLSGCIDDFRELFKDNANLKNIDGLSNWNVSKVTDFSYMFCGCSSLESLEPLSD